MKKGITARSENYSQWYLDIVEQAELAENSAVRGCMIIKPHGYAIWEMFQKTLDQMFKDTGHKNAYFPIFIPKSFLSKEAKHVDGFAQESAVVTHHRLRTNPDTKEVEVDPESKLEEELIVRPTSETIIYDSFSRWIQSYRDLPILINQWANVVRWEMRTRPFLRTAEFLWQEGHTAHATEEEAEAEAKQMLEVYTTFAQDYLAIPVIAGEKSESERFAGALRTYTIEAMMQDGKALQSGTSHNLGQNFAKAFDLTFTDANEQIQHAWTTSWGLSTRMMGALIMVHSDDKGLVLPPKIAPEQVVIIPIWKTEEDKKRVMSSVDQIREGMDSDIRVTVDTREHLSPGWKFNEWEKKGLPLRIEIGPRDVENNTVVLARRDTSEKLTIVFENLNTKIKDILAEIQSGLFQKAKSFLDERTIKVDSFDELKEVVEHKQGFALAHWDGTTETEEKIKAETKATIRCIPFDQVNEESVCVYSGKPSKRRVVFAKAY